jgi:hypothetical protein
VTGSGKGATLRAVQERSVPAAAVKPQDGELVWFLDQAAVDSLVAVLLPAVARCVPILLLLLWRPGGEISARGCSDLTESVGVGRSHARPGVDRLAAKYGSYSVGCPHRSGVSLRRYRRSRGQYRW